MLQMRVPLAISQAREGGQLISVVVVTSALVETTSLRSEL